MPTQREQFAKDKKRIAEWARAYAEKGIPVTREALQALAAANPIDLRPRATPAKEEDEGR